MSDTATAKTKRRGRKSEAPVSSSRHFTQQATHLTRTFKVTYTDAHGKVNRARVVASGRNRARLDVEAQGFTITEIREIRRWWEITVGRAVGDSVLLQVTRQLAAFSAAGVPLLEGLGMLAQTTRNKYMRAALLTMLEDIRDGDTLPQAARVHDSVFPAYYVAMLEASERTGDVTATFETLADYLERDTNSRRAVKSALAYPAILVVMGIGAVVMLSTVVLPKFEVFFASLNTELPLATRMLLAMSAFMATWWWLIFGGLAILLVGGFLYRRTVGGRYHLDRLLLRMPVMGTLIQQIAMERFSRVLGSLSAAGVPLVDALELSQGIMGNAAYDRAVIEARSGVMRGEGLAGPMEAAGLFTMELVQILRVGEQTGRLTEQLEHAATYYAREVDYRLKNLSTLLEPIVLVVVGGAVGFVAVALVSAMYGIYTSSNLGA